MFEDDMRMQKVKKREEEGSSRYGSLVEWPKYYCLRAMKGKKRGHMKRLNGMRSWECGGLTWLSLLFLVDSWRECRKTLGTLLQCLVLSFSQLSFLHNTPTQTEHTHIAFSFDPLSNPKKIHLARGRERRHQNVFDFSWLWLCCRRKTSFVCCRFYNRR